jgi:hypothetical protein
MFKKHISLALVGLLLNLAFYSTAMATNTQNDAKFAEKVKTNIAKLGTGKNAKAKIKLKDGTKLKGYVSEFKDSGFALTNEETGISKEILYSQVEQIKGQNLSNNEKFLLKFFAFGLLLLPIIRIAVSKDGI